MRDVEVAMSAALLHSSDNMAAIKSPLSGPYQGKNTHRDLFVSLKNDYFTFVITLRHLLIFLNVAFGDFVTFHDSPLNKTTLNCASPRLK